MTILAVALERAAEVLDAAGRVVAVGHVRPDGDALGSALALAHAARDAGKEAWASFPDPFVLPESFRFLDLGPLVPVAELAVSDVAVVCDTAEPGRLGDALAVVERAGHLVVVDHHPGEGGFGDVVVVDPSAAATAQLVHRLLRRLRWPISEATATALYTGIVTDTGRFQYSSTTPEVHRIAAELLAAGVRPEVVGRHLYEEVPFGYYAVVARVMGRAVLEADLRLVWSILRRDDLEAGGIPAEEADGLIDLVRLAREADVALLLKELEPGVVKGSLRSRGRVDVGAVAAGIGGGGHHNAAGFTFRGSVADAVAAVREALG